MKENKTHTQTSGGWQFQQKLIPSNLARYDYFGISVSLSGDTAAIGASGYSKGAVFIYIRSGTTWTLQQTLDSFEANINFATAVSIRGNRVIIGADKSASTTGATFIYEGNGTVWGSKTKIVPSTGVNTNDRFGWSVSCDTNSVIVGAPSVGNASRTGFANVYVRNIFATWVRQGVLMPVNGSAGEEFGVVGISGDIAVVGAIFVNGNVGAVYTFARIGSVWSQTQKLKILF